MISLKNLKEFSFSTKGVAVLGGVIKQSGLTKYNMDFLKTLIIKTIEKDPFIGHINNYEYISQKDSSSIKLYLSIIDHECIVSEVPNKVEDIEVFTRDEFIEIEEKLVMEEIDVSEEIIVDTLPIKKSS